MLMCDDWSCTFADKYALAETEAQGGEVNCCSRGSSRQGLPEEDYMGQGGGSLSFVPFGLIDFGFC